MTTALYRRYRPETFDEVIGQEHVTEPLKAALKGGRVTHAYLFSGPRGCGKTTSARIFARCLNCAQGPTDTPCGTCDSCVELARGGSGSLDVVEIDAASHNGVDDARELRERAAFAPARDRYKIFILDEAHMVTPQGFNALLKLVEEPPDHVKFIFATTEPEKVIGTIRSRTHHYPFRLVPPNTLGSYLEQLATEEGVSIEAGVVPMVVRAGAGSVRDSLSVLDQLIAGAPDGVLTYDVAAALLGFTSASLLDDAVGAIAGRDGAALFQVVDHMVQSGLDPRRFVEDLLQRLRDLVILAIAGESGEAALGALPDDQLERMRVQAANLGGAGASRAADLTNQALSEMSGAISPRLQLELLCARLLLPADGDAGSTGQPPAAPDGGQRPAPSTHARPAQERTAAAPPRGAASDDDHEARPVASADSSGPRPSSTAAASTPRPAVTHEDASERASASARAAAAFLSEEDDAADQPAPEPANEGARPEPAGEPAQERTGVPQPVPAAQQAGDAPRTDAPTAHASESPQPAGAPRGTAPATDAPATSDATHGSDHASPAGPDSTLVRRRWGEVLETLSGIRRASWALVAQSAVVGELHDDVLTLVFDTPGLVGAFHNGGHNENVQIALRETLGLSVAVRGTTGDAAAARPDRNRPPHQGRTDQQSARSTVARTDRAPRGGTGHAEDLPPEPSEDDPGPEPVLDELPLEPPAGLDGPAADREVPPSVSSRGPSADRSDLPAGSHGSSVAGRADLPADVAPIDDPDDDDALFAAARQAAAVPVEEEPESHRRPPPTRPHHAAPRGPERPPAPADDTDPGPEETRPVEARPAPGSTAEAMPSPDDVDIEGSDMVGIKVIERILGGRVVEEDGR